MDPERNVIVRLDELRRWASPRRRVILDHDIVFVVHPIAELVRSVIFTTNPPGDARLVYNYSVVNNLSHSKLNHAFGVFLNQLARCRDNVSLEIRPSFEVVSLGVGGRVRPLVAAAFADRRIAEASTYHVGRRSFTSRHAVAALARIHAPDDLPAWLRIDRIALAVQLAPKVYPVVVWDAVVVRGKHARLGRLDRDAPVLTARKVVVAEFVQVARIADRTRVEPDQRRRTVHRVSAGTGNRTHPPVADRQFIGRRRKDERTFTVRRAVLVGGQVAPLIGL